MGALQYATVIRLEISYAVNKVCTFQSNPLEDNLKVVKRILRYLQGSITQQLHLAPTNLRVLVTITSFCDVDYAFDPDDKRSTLRACIYLGPNLVSW